MATGGPGGLRCLALSVWTGLHDFVKLTQGAGISLDAAQQRCLISPPIQAMKFRGDFGPDGTPLVKVNGATYPLGQRETGEPVYRVQPLRDEHYRAHGVASDEATDRQRNAKAAVEWQRSAMSSSGWVIDCPEGAGLSIHRGDVHVLNNFVNAQYVAGVAASHCSAWCASAHGRATHPHAQSNVLGPQWSHHRGPRHDAASGAPVC